FECARFANACIARDLLGDAVLLKRGLEILCHASALSEDEVRIPRVRRLRILGEAVRGFVHQGPEALSHGNVEQRGTGLATDSVKGCRSCMRDESACFKPRRLCEAAQKQRDPLSNRTLLLVRGRLTNKRTDDVVDAIAAPTRTQDQRT